MNPLAPGSLLGQVRPSSTASTTAYTATLETEITQIKVCNTSGAGRTFRLFHDDDGTTYDETTALHWDESVSANTTTSIQAQELGGGISIRKDGTIGVKSDAANGLTFSLYGIVRAAR